jgi:hypothetical protein
MATGGIFTIITNDGKQDRMLMATALLSKRLSDINQLKGGGDSLAALPTLLDIEKTHILFTNAHFKPFAAIGFEYNKVKATSGNPSLGSTIQFSIPQFGDFFHDICCHVVLHQPVLTSTATNTSDTPAMRWCDFPGERLLKKVQQEVNGNPLDEYTHHATNMHREYRVSPNVKLGWDRCVGQEEPEQGFVTQPNWANSGLAPQAHRVAAQVHTGNQTPTAQKTVGATGALEMFIPLLFWYNKDVRLAVPSVAIPYGQRFINIDLASLEELCNVYPRGAGTAAVPLGSVAKSDALQTIELYINNIFVNPEVHNIYIKRIGFSLIRVHRQQLYSANSSDHNLLLQQLKWPIEYLYVGMKVRAYHNTSSSEDLVNGLNKWHTFSQQVETPYVDTGRQGAKETLLVTLTTGTVGVAATGVLTGTGVLQQTLVVGDVVRVAGVNYSVSVGAAAAADVTDVTVQPAPAVAVTATVDNAKVTRGGAEYETLKCTKTLDKVSITAHGIPIYNDFESGFFNAYTTYHYGGPNINTPKDCGLCFVPFCLYPGTYQPSGHINVSRAREFYIQYTSSVIDATTLGTLVVIASAINFLLISDGSAVLRYST